MFCNRHEATKKKAIVCGKSPITQTWLSVKKAGQRWTIWPILYNLLSPKGKCDVHLFFQ